MDDKIEEYETDQESKIVLAKVDKMIKESKENQNKIKNLIVYIQSLNNQNNNENI